MLYRALLSVSFVLMAPASVAQQAPFSHQTGCSIFAMPYDRSMLVCRGVPSIQAVAATLRHGAARSTNLKVIGRNYQLPPWEITGVRSAGYDRSLHYQTAAQVIEVDRRTFAVYPRNGTTILVERR